MIHIDSYSHCCSPMEMSCRSYQFATFPECKFRSPSLARVRFNQLPLNRTTRSSLPRFRCHSEPVTLSPEGRKNRKNGNKEVVYRGNILSALRSLESGNSIEETLGSRNFSRRAKLAILIEQKSWERVVAVFEFFKSQKDYKPDFIDYFIVLHALGFALKWDEWRHYWAEMAKSGVYPEKSTYRMLVTVFGRAGLVMESLLWIKHMKLRGYFPDKRHIDIVVGTLKKAGDYDLADMIYKEWSAGIVDLDDLQFDSSADFSDVFKHFLSTEQFRTTPGEEVASDSAKVQTSIKNAYTEKGMWAESKNILNGRKDDAKSNMDVYKFHLKLKAYGRAKLYDKALSLFRSMMDHIDLPKVSAYNSIIRILSDGGLADEARILFDEMLGEGLKPIFATFVPLMLCYSRLGRLTDAVDIYQKMILAKVKPNVVVYEALIDGFLESGDLEAALKYLRVMEDESGISPGKTVLTSLIKACCKLGKQGSVDQVKQLFDKAMTLEGGLDTNSSNTVLAFYAECMAVPDAEMVFNSMKEKGLVDDASYKSMIFMYRKMGMLEKANEVAKEMIHSSGLPSDPVSYHDAIVSYLRNRQLRPAGELLHKMLNKMKKKKKTLNPDSRTIDLIFNILREEGLKSEAVAQLEESYKQNKPYAVRASVASVFSLLGLHGLAMEFYEAFTIANDRFLDLVGYNAAIYVYASAGETDKALEMFTKMKDKGLEPDKVTNMNMANCYKKAIEDVTKRYTN